MKVMITTGLGRKIEANINGNKAIIGRSNKCNVMVSDETLSRQHCQVDLDNGTFFVTDLGSSNGVFIDGTRIPANVKTIVNSYNQLSLASLECALEDSDFMPSQKTDILESEIHQDERTKIQSFPTKKIKRDALNNPLIMKNAPKDKNQAMGFIFPVLIILGGIAYVTMEKDEIQMSTETTTAPQNIPAYKKSLEVSKTLPDEFRASPDYLELAQKITCNNFISFCNSLSIDLNQHEGLIKEPGEYIVYLNPGRRLTEEKYLKIKDHQEALDIVAMDILISSQFFDEFILQKIDQISVVIVDQTGKPLKVYRIHSRNIVPTSISRLSLLSGLAQALNELKPEAFWNLFKVPKKDLAN